MRSVTALAIVLVGMNELSAAVFQFATPVETRKGDRMAFLWVPPESPRIRGVVIGGMTLMERELAKDPRIRSACAEVDVAIVFLKCGLGATDIQTTLDRLAAASGYEELSTAPLMFIGHSAGGPQARKRAKEMSERCFGLVQYRGADPGDVDHDGKDGLPPGIPAVMMIGQFDEFGRIGRDDNDVENWEKDRDKLAKFRAQNERHVGCILVEPGGGHFAWSNRNAEILALFIPRAARARLPDESGTVALKEVDPASGWLTDLSLRSEARKQAAPYAAYTGNRHRAAWHLDQTLAEAVETYHSDLTKRDQFISWDDPHRVNGGARNFFTRVDWLPDGQSFVVHPRFATTYPTQDGGRRQRWGRAGESVGHALTPVFVRPVSGPLVAANPPTLRLQFDALAPATESARVTFMAFSPGDDEYRYTERVGMISSDLLTADQGKSQSITFPPMGELTAMSRPVVLQATSTSGLPVEYYVAAGPGRIVDGRLEIAELPHRARYPVTIRVVAWQAGRRVEPFVQAAEPVEQTVRISDP